MLHEKGAIHIARWAIYDIEKRVISRKDDYKNLNEKDRLDLIAALEVLFQITGKITHKFVNDYFEENKDKVEIDKLIKSHIIFQKLMMKDIDQIEKILKNLIINRSIVRRLRAKFVIRKLHNGNFGNSPTAKAVVANEALSKPTLLWIIEAANDNDNNRQQEAA